MFSVDWQSVEHIWPAKGYITAVWAFGSAQEGWIRPGSDLDIGVFFISAPSLDELADLRSELQNVLQFDDIDLVVLNTASPITRFEIISGRLIYCRDQGKLAEIASLTAREYEDSMAFIQLGLTQRPR
jgi:predicted nucleotidyltransferase